MKKSIIKFEDEYLVAFVCYKDDDDRVNHMYFSSVKSYSIYNFDYGTNIIYFKMMEDLQKMKLILNEILTPKYKMCEKLLVSVNGNMVKIKEIGTTKLIRKDSVEIDGHLLICRSADLMSIRNLKAIWCYFDGIRLQLL